MKARLLVLISFIPLLSLSRGECQNTSPYWSLAGNSNATGSSMLGTKTTTPLRIFTNNIERLRISHEGKIGIGTSRPKGRLTINHTGGNPPSSWTPSTSPIFVGFSQTNRGDGDYILAMASNDATTAPYIIGRRARGSIGTPQRVADQDIITSVQASGYDGRNFQNSASINFIVNHQPAASNVPMRIAFLTGSSSVDRHEAVSIDYTGFVGLGITSPQFTLDVAGSVRARGWDFGVTGHSAGIIQNPWTEGGGYVTLGGVGVSGIAYADEGVGVYGLGLGAGGIGIYGSSTQYYAGYFAGDVYSSGNYLASDSNFKKNVGNIENAISLIATLQPRIFEYRQDGVYKPLNLPAGKHYGLVSQELARVLPSLVKDAHLPMQFDSTSKQKVPPIQSEKSYSKADSFKAVNYQAVNYTELVPIVIRALQEQQKQIEELKERLNQIEKGR